MNYAISDFHLWHKNIVKYEPIRPENFAEVIWNNWNKTVKPEDTVYFLGDLAFEQFSRTKEYITTLPGKKIMVKGNHDKFSNKQYLEIFSEVHLLWLIVGKYFMSHYPITNEDPRYKDRIAEVRRNFELSGCEINVHGHTHSRMSKDPRCMNVSIEVTNFSPRELP